MAAADKNAVTNPTLLVEVTSSSTEDYDRGETFCHYKQCQSLCAVVFVSHRRPQVTLLERIDEAWTQREFRAGDIVHVSHPVAELAVDELYAGISLSEE